MSALRIKHLKNEKASSNVPYIKLSDKNVAGRRRWNILRQEQKVCDVKVIAFRLLSIHFIYEIQMT